MGKFEYFTNLKCWAIGGWFPFLAMIPVRSQWGRYNLPRIYIYAYIYICVSIATFPGCDIIIYIYVYIYILCIYIYMNLHVRVSSLSGCWVFLLHSFFFVSQYFRNSSCMGRLWEWRSPSGVAILKPTRLPVISGVARNGANGYHIGNR